MFIISLSYEEYLIANWITDPEDIEAINDTQGIEIRLMMEDGDEHEGYYDTIDEAIETLEELRKIYPHLSRKENK